MATPIVLSPDQEVHVERLMEILASSDGWAMDLSMLGAGKTYTSTVIAQTLARRYGTTSTLVVCPKAVVGKWMHMQTAHGLPLLEEPWTWRKMAGSKGRNQRVPKFKHPYLLAHEESVDDSNPPAYKTVFETTRAWKDLVSRGVFLVMDEFQNIKNANTDQMLCARALISDIVDSAKAGGRSRVLLLSGSPVDKHEHVATMMRNVGVIVHSSLSTQSLQHGHSQRVWTGARDMENYADAMDREETKRQRISAGHDNPKLFVSKAFTQVVKGFRAHAMQPPRMDFSVNKCNAMYEVADEEDRNKIKLAVEDVESAASFNKETGQVELSNHDRHNSAARLALLSKCMAALETAKLSLFERVARERLESDPNIKVVICVNYVNSVLTLAERLGSFSPVTMQGSDDLPRRAAVLQAFNARNRSFRLMIGNVKVMSTGIDLDDKDGRFPRVALVSPNYSTIDQYQLGHRFLRMDTASDSTLHFVFAAHCPESRVLDALSKKGNVMKEITNEQADAGVVFPGSYSVWHENPVPVQPVRMIPALVA